MMWIVALVLASVPSAAWAAGQKAAAKAGKSELPRATSTELVVLAVAAGVLVLLWLGDVIRPGSLERRARRDFRSMPAMVWFCCAAMLFLSPMIGSGIAASLPASVMGSASGIKAKAIVALLAYGTGLAGVGFLLYLLRPHGAANEATGLRARGSDVPLGLLGLALALPVVLATGIVSTMVVMLVTHKEPPAIAHDALNDILSNGKSPWRWALVGVAVLAAPVIEELVYRVFLQAGIGTLVKSRGVAIAVTSAIFAAAHLSAVPPYALPSLFVLGVALGIAYERTGRLGVPIVMHMGFNAANVWMAMRG